MKDHFAIWNNYKELGGQILVILERPHYSITMSKASITFLRVISIIEGLSYIYLLYHAIYSKRVLGIDDAIKLPGQIHGALFTIFCISLLVAMILHKWQLKIPALIFLASLIPFAPIWVEIWLKKYQERT